VVVPQSILFFQHTKSVTTRICDNRFALWKKSGLLETLIFYSTAYRNDPITDVPNTVPTSHRSIINFLYLSKPGKPGKPTNVYAA
jgi:hypothetical protein